MITQERLKELVIYDEHTGFFIDALRRAIAATPAESLQAHDDELIEKCAKVCDDNGGHTNGIAENLAFKISALKQEVK